MYDPPVDFAQIYVDAAGDQRTRIGAFVGIGQFSRFDLSDYRDFAEARAQICRFIDRVYNVKRIQSSLR